jgi:arylsulfatase A-like enzyme
MKFTQAYAAAPVCSPYRAALLTGQYPARVGIIDYMRWESDPLSKDHITLAEMLQKSGYKTGLIGKWHLTGYKDKGAKDEVFPEEHGFDEAILWEKDKNEKNFQAWYDDKNEYITDRLGKEAVQFINRWQDQPFFLYLSHYAVHTWLGGKGHLINKYRFKNADGRYQRSGYEDKVKIWKEQYVTPSLGAVLESLDQTVGMVMDKLDELGLSENTIVVFTSDNGGEEFVTSNVPLRAGKSTLYEGGLRVPLVVRWPDNIPANTLNKFPTCNFDFYPTLAEAVGITPNPAQHMDGRSILSVLKDPENEMTPETYYWHYPLEKKHFLGGRSSGAIRHGDWKLKSTIL